MVQDMKSGLLASCDERWGLLVLVGRGVRHDPLLQDFRNEGGLWGSRDVE